jgi:hypothetical protein
MTKRTIKVHSFHSGLLNRVDVTDSANSRIGEVVAYRPRNNWSGGRTEYTFYPTGYGFESGLSIFTVEKIADLKARLSVTYNPAA